MKKLFVIPDIHSPFHDRLAIRLMLLALKEFKPDIVVQLGDLIDCYSLSSFSIDPLRRKLFKDEVETTNDHGLIVLPKQPQADPPEVQEEDVVPASKNAPLTRSGLDYFALIQSPYVYGVPPTILATADSYEEALATAALIRPGTDGYWVRYTPQDPMILRGTPRPDIPGKPY